MSLKPISANQFSLLRVLLACYLLIHLWGLFVGVDIFADQGMLSELSLMPTWGVLPNLFGYQTPNDGLQCSELGHHALCRTWPWFQAAHGVIGLVAVWMSLFNRNILISNPSLPFIGLLLLVLAALPSGEPNAMDEPVAEWHFPTWVYWGLLITLMGGYTASGCHKLLSPSWIDGTALSHVLELPIARPNFLRGLLLDLPDTMIQFMTWSALGMEVMALPLTLFRPTRRWIWLGLLIMNVSIRVIDFADLDIWCFNHACICFHQRAVAACQVVRADTCGVL